jgi:hypothetical protein
MKKKCCFVALVILCLVVAILWPGVTNVNFNRITPGMTMDEVNGIFGRPGETLVYWTADNVRYENQRWDGRFGGWATVSFAEPFGSTAGGRIECGNNSIHSAFSVGVQDSGSCEPCESAGKRQPAANCI